MRKLLLAFALAPLMVACGYDGSYRYECQDPANWEEDYCNPPACLVDGMCTENLIGFDPDDYETTTTEPTPVIGPAPTEETVAP